MFVPLFMLTFADPQSIERAGQSFIEWKLSSEAEEKIDSIQLPTSNKLGSLLNKYAGAKIDELKQQLKDDLPAILAAEIARMRDLSCECRKKWEQRIATSLNIQISTLDVAREKIADFSQAKYMEIVTKLTADVRIFLGVNSVVFLAFLIISFLKPQAVLHLFVPGILLLVSTVLCSYFYLFEQNWFFTILYDDYTGFAYLGYLIFVFGVLCDIAFNRGRITTEVLNAIFKVVGHAADAVPC